MQGDLFGMPTLTAPTGSNAQKTAFLERHRVTLRLDQALMALIALLVLYVLIFSFGVEKGKRLGMAELKVERAKHERVVRELGGKFFAQNPALLSASVKTETARIEPAKTATDPITVLQSSSQLPAGKYTIQLVTYMNPSDAEREIKRLAGQGLQGFVIPSGRYQQVCVDAFESREKASQTLRDLKSRQVAARDAYVRPIPQIN